MNRLGGRSGHNGFAMIELVVVVIIVALLSSTAVPIYRKYIRSARMTEATTRIGEIVRSSRAYAVSNQNGSGIPVWPPAAGKGIVDLTASPNFTYTIRSGGGAVATGPLAIRATGIAGKKLAGVTVDVTVPNIMAGAGKPVVVGL